MLQNAARLSLGNEAKIITFGLSMKLIHSTLWGLETLSERRFLKAQLMA